MSPPAQDDAPLVVLGVAGGIAAYKAVLLLRLLTESGHRVQVVPTAAALEFVGAATWEALSGRRVSHRVWDDVPDVPHVRIGQQADLVVVAPATADLLARAAHGLADDLLTSTLLTARCPVLMAPAMHTEMWQHPATRANVATLRERGVQVLEPASGRLTGADTGPGRLPEPEAIAGAAQALLAAHGRGQDLAGLHVVVSAGGTREALDPVRFLGNISSGRQGVALAQAAAARGARVSLVAAHLDVALPAGVAVQQVRSAADLAAAMTSAAEQADVLVMAAAVADFAPARVAEHKIKKVEGQDSAPSLELVRTPDVLRALVEGRRPGQLVVGFAAETGDPDADPLTHARAKLARKGCDLLVLNDVSAGRVFGSDRTQVTVLSAGGGVSELPPGSKLAAAHGVLDAVLALRRPAPAPTAGIVGPADTP